MRAAPNDILSFLKGHWPHLVLAVPGVVAFTALHELAHCVVVWMQGGRVTGFVWLPSGSEWGRMRYVFPTDGTFSTAAVSLSPYVAWVALCLFAGLLSLKRTPWPFWCASTIYVWLFIVPVADIANAAVPYLLFDARNDFRQALGPTRPLFALMAAICGLVAAAYGYPLQRRLYRDRAVGFPAYCILAAVALIVIVAVNFV